MINFDELNAYDIIFNSALLINEGVNFVMRSIDSVALFPAKFTVVNVLALILEALLAACLAASCGCCPACASNWSCIVSIARGNNNFSKREQT